jgi:hypothetical protein
LNWRCWGSGSLEPCLSLLLKLTEGASQFLEELHHLLNDGLLGRIDRQGLDVLSCVSHGLLHHLGLGTLLSLSLMLELSLDPIERDGCVNLVIVARRNGLR